MSRILAYTGSDSRKVARALSLAQDSLSAVEASEGWGIGYEQEGQVLLRKWPQSVPSIELSRLGAELRTRAFLALADTHRRSRARRDENVQPFRWRSWIFALLGENIVLGESREPLEEELPDFLRRNMRGDTDEELFFHLFLGRLRGRGVNLQSLWVPLEESVGALKDLVLDLEARGVTLSVGLAITDGRNLLALSTGVPLCALHVRNLEKLPGHETRAVVRGSRNQIPFHASMVTDGALEGWAPLEARKIYTVATDGELGEFSLG